MANDNLLTEERKNQILELIQKLSDDSSDDGRIDIVRFASNNGFSVYRLSESSKNKGIILVNTKGNFISDDLRTDKIIAFKRSIPESQNRFIIAHELGHYFLHSTQFAKDGLFKYAYHDNEDKSDILEIEADYFAANLLVPKDAFLEMYNLYKDLKDNQLALDRLASYFGVSMACVQKRIDEVVNA